MILETGLMCLLLIIFFSIGILYSWQSAFISTIVLIGIVGVIFFLMQTYEKIKLKIIRRKYDKEKNESRNPREFAGRRSDGRKEFRPKSELPELNIAGTTNTGGIAEQDFEPAVGDNIKGSGADELDTDEFDSKFDSTDGEAEPGDDGETGEDSNNSESDLFTPC